ncbi:MAG: GIY-YIG nuclease family protein [Polyangiaceae bacterium]|nr:GIY-YIG nuclease family protein [Polyangiaceae bacterium]
MRWEDEPYVRAYTRDTPEFCALSWEARALFWELMRKCDRAGVLLVGKAGVRGLAGLVRIPLEVVERALHAPDGLLADGCVVAIDGGFIIPNYIPGQTAKQSDKARKQEQRARERATRLATSPVTKADAAIDAVLEEPKRGTLYAVRPKVGGEVKFGFTVSLRERLWSMNTGRSDRLELVVACPGTAADEGSIHERLAAVQLDREWFSDGPEAQLVIAEMRQKADAASANGWVSGIGVTKRDASSETDGAGHAESHAVTLSLAERSEAKQISISDPPALPPPPENPASETAAAGSGLVEHMVRALAAREETRPIANRTWAGSLLGGAGAVAAADIDDAVGWAAKELALDAAQGGGGPLVDRAIAARVSSGLAGAITRRRNGAARNGPRPSTQPARKQPSPEEFGSDGGWGSVARGGSR